LIGYADKLGGVKFVTSREKARSIAEAMLRHPLKTKQTGPEGQKINKLMVQADAEPAKEFYLGMVLDRAQGVPVMMASAEGGMDIEEVAATHPEKIFKVPVSPELGLQSFQARRLAFDLGFNGDQVDKAETIMMALSKVFLEKDASLAEINPLAITKKGDVVALDAKIDFDDNALFRHKDIELLRDVLEENPVEVRASQANLNFIQLDGNIGCLVNGAGLAMGTMDIIKYHGGEPANFLDVGGGVTPEAASEAFQIILSDPKVKGILVNIFGGIAKCDLIAEALVKAGREVGFKVPVIVRLEGTNVEKAREILNGVKKELPMIQVAPGLTEAAKMVVAAAKG
jgi:succinyl-CoA synthetase beta subunit